MNGKFASALENAQQAFEQSVHFSVNPDVNRRMLRVYGRDAAVYFMDGMISTDFMQHYLLTPCVAHADDTPERDLVQSLKNMLPVMNVQQTDSVRDAVDKLMNGMAVMLTDGLNCALCFDLRMFVRRSIAPPLTESVVNGPHQGFNEALRDNVTLIRRILHTPDLIGEMTTVGSLSPVNLSIMYIKGIADETSVARVKQRLAGIRTDHVMSAGELEQLIEDRPFALLPQCLLTERPDRAASCLLEGQVVIVMDGAPQVLVMPVSILHLFHTPDDTSLRWQYGSFLRLIRMIGALCTLLLPGLFVASVTFHPEALPVTLLTAILESQAEVPLSIPAETFLMLMMFNLINEAGTRVPGVVGNSLGTVSGLILGQAAVEAKLIHPLLIIVVAVSSLGSYAIPDYSLGLAFRIGQLMLLGVACIFGFYGMVLFLAVTVIRLCAMRSLGSPLAAPISPERTHNPDIMIRWPLWRQRLRTWLSNPQHMDRTKGRMRRWDGGSHENGQ